MSPKARSTVDRWPRRLSRRSSAGPFHTLGSRQTDPESLIAQECRASAYLSGFSTRLGGNSEAFKPNNAVQLPFSCAIRGAYRNEITFAHLYVAHACAKRMIQRHSKWELAVARGRARPVSSRYLRPIGRWRASPAANCAAIAAFAVT